MRSRPVSGTLDKNIVEKIFQFQEAVDSVYAKVARLYESALAQKGEFIAVQTVLIEGMKILKDIKLPHGKDRQEVLLKVMENLGVRDNNLGEAVVLIFNLAPKLFKASKGCFSCRRRSQKEDSKAQNK
jgi:hypothetical protein